MNYILSKFWQWAEITPKEYATNGIPLTSEKAPFNYPLFDQLVGYAKQLLMHKELTKEELSDFLTIMALDNETEDVLDFATDNATESQIQQILQFGVKFPQFEARWQLAELAYRRKPNRYLEYLNILYHDSNDYVKKRAGNCLEYLGVKKE